jgi:hypothetical protein
MCVGAEDRKIVMSEGDVKNKCHQPVEWIQLKAVLLTLK